MGISKKVAVLFGVLGLAAGTAGTIALQTHAAGTGITAATTQSASGFKHGTLPAAAGSVTAVSGSTLTVTDRRSGIPYTVNAGSATIQKFTQPSGSSQAAAKPAPTTIDVSGIAVGDNVIIQGTVSGSQIIATKITDGMMGPRGFKGQGQHGALGTVSAVSGGTITLKGKNGTTYTINAGSASVKKVSDSSVSNIAVGDTLEVNGSTNGTTITATNITDGMPGMGQYSRPPTTTSPPANQ